MQMKTAAYFTSSLIRDKKSSVENDNTNAVTAWIFNSLCLILHNWYLLKIEACKYFLWDTEADKELV